jgi:hypothetical protein
VDPWRVIFRCSKRFGLAISQSALWLPTTVGFPPNSVTFSGSWSRGVLVSYEIVCGCGLTLSFKDVSRVACDLGRITVGRQVTEFQHHFPLPGHRTACVPYDGSKISVTMALVTQCPVSTSVLLSVMANRVPNFCGKRRGLTTVTGFLPVVNVNRALAFNGSQINFPSTTNCPAGAA